MLHNRALLLYLNCEGCTWDTPTSPGSGTFSIPHRNLGIYLGL